MMGWRIIAIEVRRGGNMVCKWLALFLLAAALGCSASSAPKASKATRELQEQLLVRYAEQYIKQKDFQQAIRFVEAIPADSPHAAKVPEFKKQIEQIILEHDQSVAERYSKEKTISIDLSALMNTCQGHELMVTGKAALPRYTRLKVSLWREETPNNWQLF